MYELPVMIYEVRVILTIPISNTELFFGGCLITNHFHANGDRTKKFLVEQKNETPILPRFMCDYRWKTLISKVKSPINAK